MTFRRILSLASAGVMMCAIATVAHAETGADGKKAQPTQAPKQQTDAKNKKQKSWEPICPPDCGTSKK